MPLKIKAFIPPPTLRNKSYYNARLQQAYERFRRLLEQDLDSFTRDWASQPFFEIRRETTRDDFTISVSTDDPVFNWVDRGTRPHYISARNDDRPLRFSQEYAAATQPGSLRSQRPEYSGGKVSKFIVYHPGIEARGFSEELVRERERDFQRLMLEALLP